MGEHHSVPSATVFWQQTCGKSDVFLLFLTYCPFLGAKCFREQGAGACASDWRLVSCLESSFTFLFHDLSLCITMVIPSSSVDRQYRHVQVKSIVYNFGVINSTFYFWKIL